MTDAENSDSSAFSPVTAILDYNKCYSWMYDCCQWKYRRLHHPKLYGIFVGEMSIAGKRSREQVEHAYKTTVN